MSYELETARRYRAHADELRAIAQADRFEPTRLMLLKVAGDYIKMAEQLETNAELQKRLDGGGR